MDFTSTFDQINSTISQGAGTIANLFQARQDVQQASRATPAPVVQSSPAPAPVSLQSAKGALNNSVMLGVAALLGLLLVVRLVKK